MVSMLAFSLVFLSVWSILNVGMEKAVLVSMGENKRVVHIPAAAEAVALADSDALSQAIQDTFKDILQPGQEFFLQLKSEEWGGVFLNLLGQAVIADRSVVRAVVKPVTEVSRLAL